MNDILGFDLFGFGPAIDPGPLGSWSRYYYKPQPETAPLTIEQVDILRHGAARLHDLGDVGAGYGRDVHRLVNRGLMKLAARRPDSGYLVHEYKVTDEGRCAYLAEIGVHEIMPERT